MANKSKESKKEYAPSLKTYFYITNQIAKSRKKFEKLNNTVNGMLISLSSKQLNVIKQINTKLLL